MSKQSNPPIKGHELLHEGRTQLYGARGTSCGCRCGERPDGWETLSVNDMKRWHREHKAELRAEDDD